MQAPPSLGREYTEAFRAIYPALAQANGVELVPPRSRGVGGQPRLNQADGIHPTAGGHRRLADDRTVPRLRLPFWRPRERRPRGS